MHLTLRLQRFHTLIITPDLGLTYAVEPENLLAVPQNPLLSDHPLITFGFTLADRATGDRKVCYSRCVSEDTRDRFGAEITSLLPLAPLTSTLDNTVINVTPAVFDCCVNDTAATLCRDLDSEEVYRPLDTGRMERKWRLSRSAGSQNVY